MNAYNDEFKDFDFMTKEFGVSGINRDMFTDCFDEAIHMDNVSDEDMQKLAEDIESVVRQKFPDVADKMFELWQKDDMTFEEYDLMAVGEYKEVFDFFWEELGKISVTTYGRNAKGRK
jgi:hypothetical protein